MPVRQGATYVAELMNANQDSNDQTKLLRRQAVIRKRTIEIRSSKNGQLINPESENFLLEVSKELDRTLLRTVKDTPWPPATVNYRDSNGTTPLAYLCFKGDLVLVRLFCEIKGIDVNLSDNEGNTPLMLASQGGHGSIVTFLLETFKNEIDLNKRNHFGLTCLMKAALQGRVKIVKSLLSAGANESLRDPNKGFTALEWSQFTGRKSCIEALKNHIKSSQHKNSKRLSQALCETESWLKSKLNNNGAPNGTNSSCAKLESSCILAASGSAVLCGASIVTTAINSDSDSALEESQKRSFIIPAIEITQA